MISRNPRNYTINPERNNEAAFTGTTGIDTTRAPTFRECVYDATNFDVETDGALTLRKPLILLSKNRFLSENVKIIRHTFNPNFKIVLGTLNELALVCNGMITPITFKYTDKYDVKHSFKFPGFTKLQFVDFSKATIFNTASSTIITGVKVSLEYYDLDDPSISELTEGYRYLRLYTINDEWFLEMINPEPTTINSADSVPFNPDTTLDNVYAIKDDYYAPLVNVEAILAYTNTVKYKEQIEVIEQGTLVSDSVTKIVHKEV